MKFYCGRKGGHVNKILREKTELWMTLERKTLEQRKKAELFYEEEMMEHIVKEYIRNNKGKLKEKAKYLIVSVGTSYEPIVLNISLLRPERILFLYTSQSEEILDKVMEFCGLKMSQVEKSKVNETNQTDIYREIKRCYLEWGKPEKIYIDFTGGTKAMSTASAMAGAMIHVQMIYVGTNQYMRDFRKPLPGTETLFYINSPMDVFGDLKIDKAYSLFEQYNYAGAREKLEEIKEEIPDPVVRQELNYVYKLAQTYEYWDSLEFIKAYQTMRELVKGIERDSQYSRHFVLQDFLEHFQQQEQLLKNLKDIPELTRQKRNIEILQEENYVVPLMFSMYQNAKVREYQEKYDMATLLFYRLWELIEQRRLSLYQLFVSKMEYMKMKIDGKEITEGEFANLKERVAELKKGVFGRNTSAYLPEQISLLEGFILLAALGDPIIWDGKNTVARLKRIRAMVLLRNNSIFAHGLAPVETSDYMKFQKFVVELFMEFCTLEKIDFPDLTKQMEWVSPLESEYYQMR